MQERIKSDQLFGRAVVDVRRIHGLRQSGIRGLSDRQIRRIEAGTVDLAPQVVKNTAPHLCPRCLRTPPPPRLRRAAAGALAVRLHWFRTVNRFRCINTYEPDSGELAVYHKLDRVAINDLGDLISLSIREVGLLCLNK